MAFTQPPAAPTAMPPAPNRTMDNVTFSNAVDTFLAWLATFAAWLIGYVSWITINLSEMATALVNVTTSQNAAATSATNAASSATAAAGTANAAAWVSGNNYLLNANAISQIDFQTYRRKIAGAGTIDPKLNQVNWTLLNPTPAATSIYLANNFQGF